MPRLATRLLLMLALLGALWHPLCGCSGLWMDGSQPSTASCCTTPDEAPRTDPCGKPPGECDCERELVLGSDGDSGWTFRLPALDLPPGVPTLSFVGALDVRVRPAPRAAPAHPPDRTRPLPLRI